MVTYINTTNITLTQIPETEFLYAIYMNGADVLIKYSKGGSRSIIKRIRDPVKGNIFL